MKTRLSKTPFVRSVGFFGILIILVLLLSPFSKMFFQAVDNLAEGVTWLQGLR